MRFKATESPEGLVTVAHAGCCWVTNLHHKRGRQGRNHANRKYDLDHTRGILRARPQPQAQDMTSADAGVEAAPLSPPGYPGDLPCPTERAAVQSNNDEDQSMLQRATLLVRQERHGEAELR